MFDLNIHPNLLIFVPPSGPWEEFNRAMLFNIGFVEASKQQTWDCFVFHDVDLLPEDDRNLYSCPAWPRHMSAAIDILMYRYVSLPAIVT